MSMPRKQQKSPNTAPTRMAGATPIPSPVVQVRRGIRDLTRLLLVVRAGGRCEFDDHNEYLLQHPLTLTPGNFAQMAHIVAFKEDGPRGKSLLRPAYINDVSNLMLLCPQCHKLIDDHPDQYPVSVLQKYKESHEDRIIHVTGLGPDKKTSVVQLKARIAGQTIAIPVAQVTKAVAPRYPTDAKGHLIDLTAINSEGKVFIEEACRCIKQKVERLYEPGMDVHETRHISLFALAPIPLLVYLVGVSNPHVAIGTSAFAVADDDGDLRVGDAPGGNAFCQGLKIRAAPAQQHSDTLGHKQSTLAQARRAAKHRTATGMKLRRTRPLMAGRVLARFAKIPPRKIQLCGFGGNSAKMM